MLEKKPGLLGRLKMPKVRTAVLISGRGSNMMALIEAAKAENYPATIELVISNRPDAEGLKKARTRAIKAVCIEHEKFSSRSKFEAAIQKELEAAKIELICCAGFMRVFTSDFTRKWTGRLINIHPSLLPKYKGLYTHQRVLEAGDNEHGCTVHHVTAELDSGAIIAQERISIVPGDTPQTLADKVNGRELILYPKALASIAETTLATDQASEFLKNVKQD